MHGTYAVGAMAGAAVVSGPGGRFLVGTSPEA